MANLIVSTTHNNTAMNTAVTRVAEDYLDGKPERVKRLGGRFAAMVLMPSTLSLEVVSVADRVIHYDVLTEDGRAAFQNAFVCFE